MAVALSEWASTPPDTYNSTLYPTLRVDIISLSHRVLNTMIYFVFDSKI